MYRRSNIRYEKIDDIKNELEKVDVLMNIIVTFTHEWCFETNIMKIEDSFKWLVKRGYKFIA